MEYVIYKGKGNILYTLRQEDSDNGIVNWFEGFGDTLGLFRGATELPSDPCDLELFRDTLHAVLTKVIEEKRNGQKQREK